MTKIFIVDDAAAYRDSLHRLLSLCGFEVAAAGGGPETAALVADFRPDVLLLDWRPDDRGDALRWIEQMRQGGADFPVVVASGYPCSRRESRLAGLTHVFRLTKPYSASALLATIETATGCPMPEPAKRAPARRNEKAVSGQIGPRRSVKSPVRE